MSQAIGFANKFYTLWSIEKDEVYFTDANGKHWLTGHNTRFTYHKNISFDLDKAKALYPTLEVQEDLRGKTNSWTAPNKEDLCPQIMKFGKYAGSNIDELLEQDFQYILWICENKSYSSNGVYALSTLKVKEHFKAIEESEAIAATIKQNALEAFLKTDSFEFVPERNLSIHEESAYIRVNVEGDLYVTFKFLSGTFSWNEYNGFTYGLPLVKGKAKRMKGKTVKFQFNGHIKLDEEIGFHNSFIVTNVTIL